jgi:hypothetical protein
VHRQRFNRDGCREPKSLACATVVLLELANRVEAIDAVLRVAHFP